LNLGVAQYRDWRGSVLAIERRRGSTMRAKSLLGSFGVIAVVLAATSFDASAGDDSARGRSNDVIKSRPATASNHAQKYRPKPDALRQALGIPPAILKWLAD
jgi:hypothetical protein